MSSSAAQQSEPFGVTTVAPPAAVLEAANAGGTTAGRVLRMLRRRA